VIRRLAAALTLVALGIPVPVAAAPAQSASWYEGPCLDNVGITIVVDFQELGGGVNVRCAPGPVTSGLDALDKGGIAWESARRFPGVVCRIAGKPGTDVEACGNTPPLSAYWSYWIAPRGGQWCYSNTGAGNRTPPPGTIEGWSFALGRSSANTPPPGYAPPPPIDGQPPNAVRASDCGSPPSNPPSTPTTTAPPPVPAPSPPPPTVATAPPATQVISEAPVATPASVDPPVGAAASPSTSTSSSIAATAAAASSAPSTTTSSTDASRSIDTDDAPALGGAISTTTPTGSTAALGTVDLGDDGRDNGGFGVATAIGIVVAGSLIAAGVWAARRRRLVVTP
jgi:hypothetical protein